MRNFRLTPVSFALCLLALIGLFVTFAPAGIIQAIVPQAVPAANKQGNGTLFQLSTGTATPGDCVEFDANGNTVNAVSGAACGAGGGGLVTYAGGAQTITAGTYYYPLGGGGGGNTTESTQQTLVNVAATILNLGFQESVAIGMGNTLTVTLRDNGSNTALTCQVSGTGAGGTVCSDTAHTVTTTVGDLYDWSVVTTGTIAVMPFLHISAQFGAVSSGSISVGTANQTAYYSGAGAALVGGGPGTLGQCWLSNGSSMAPAFGSCPGGGGNAITFGAYSSLPGSCSTSGNLYKTTDSAYEFICGGSTFNNAFYSGYPATLPPTVGSLTWNNQGTASANNTNGPLVMIAPTAGGTNQIRALVKAVPGSTPYTFTIGLDGEQDFLNCGSRIGITLSDGTKYLTWALSNNNAGQASDLLFEKWSAAGTSDSTYATINIGTVTPRIFLRVNNDGTDYNVSYGTDGNNFVLANSQAVANYLTATVIGIFVHPQSCGSGSTTFGTFFSWSGV